MHIFSFFASAVMHIEETSSSHSVLMILAVDV